MALGHKVQIFIIVKAGNLACNIYSGLPWDIQFLLVSLFGNGGRRARTTLHIQVNVWKGVMCTSSSFCMAESCLKHSDGNLFQHSVIGMKSDSCF